MESLSTVITIETADRAYKLALPGPQHHQPEVIWVVLINLETVGRVVCTDGPRAPPASVLQGGGVPPKGKFGGMQGWTRGGGLTCPVWQWRKKRGVGSLMNKVGGGQWGGGAECVTVVGQLILYRYTFSYLLSK